MKRLRDLFPLLDYWRYLFWRLIRSSKPIIVELQNRIKIILRASPVTDLQIAYEIFVLEVYQKPNEAPEISPQLIVDVGANVGYSVVYFADKYPDAKLVAFEPHPTNITLLDRHVEINALQSRVNIEKVAVSNCNSELFLTDAGGYSALVESNENENEYLPVKARDFFTWIGTRTVDLLKMDIEGGEYAILNDARFKSTDIRMIVLEWHNSKEISDGYKWCSERLTSLGYKLIDGKLKDESIGLLWAWKNSCT